MKIDLENIKDSLKYGDITQRYVYEVLGIKEKRMNFLLDKLDKELEEVKDFGRAVYTSLNFLNTEKVNEAEAFAILMNLFYEHGRTVEYINKLILN